MSKQKKTKKVKAWTFMQDTKKGKDFITDYNGQADIFLGKAPKNWHNPFDYYTDKTNWKPTKITITYKI